jgi:lipoprotein-anchoring transpeptidase ErfK/SrfK
MLRLMVVLLALGAMSGGAFANWRDPWDGGSRGRSQYSRSPRGGFFDHTPRWRDLDGAGRTGAVFRAGGPRPQIAPVAPKRIAFPSSYPVGSIVIDHKGRQLFLVQSATEALRYRVSVGREGFAWTGTQTVSRIVDWPDWRPPEVMRERDPSLPEHMSGGIRNPLGAKALYLGRTLYRIHGTNNPRSIGRASSSGCFRMLNGQIVDLAGRIGVGTVVTVVSRLPRALERRVAEQVRPAGDGRPS